MARAALTISGWLRYDLLRRWLKHHEVRSVLEIGPGVGALGTLLSKSHEYTGVERDPISARIAADNIGSTGRIVTGTPESIEGQFDLVCAFEVLEHVEDDISALRSWRNRMSPGGWLVVTSPAKMKLWGAHDDQAGHYRRYERDEITSKLEAAGLSNVEVEMYGFPLLNALHPVWDLLSARAQKEESIEGRTLASGRFRQPRRSLGLVTRSVAAPFALAQRPFLQTNLGTGVFATGRLRAP